MQRNLCFVLCFVLLLILFTGCVQKKVYNYGEFSSPLNSNMSFYSQTEIVYLTDNNQVIIAPFLSNNNDYLPDRIIKLQLGLLIDNPDNVEFVIWSDYRLTDIDDPEKIYVMSRVVDMPQSLPDGFVNIDLPYQTNLHAQMDLTVSVLSGHQLLYKSTLIRYKIKGSKKTL